MTLTGFDPAALTLLADLPDTSATEFADRKAQLGPGLLQPGVALITEIAARLDADLAGTLAGCGRRSRRRRTR